MDQNGGNGEFKYTGVAPQELAQPAVPATPKGSASLEEPIQWRASEFIDHAKSSSWLLLLALAVLAVSGVIYLMTRDILSTVVILVGGVAFGVFSMQKPRTLTYTLTADSIKVGEKQYSYDDFRTFSIIQEGPIPSMMLEPVRRFMPPLTIYFGPEDGERIFDAVALHIPYIERKLDAVENLMRKIRF